VAELWPTQWDMGRSESGEKQNAENRAVCEWSKQESRGGNSEGRNKKRDVNSTAQKEFPILLYFNIPVPLCTRFPFLSVFEKFQKATECYCVWQSVCPSVHIEQLSSQPDRLQMTI